MNVAIRYCQLLSGIAVFILVAFCAKPLDALPPGSVGTCGQNSVALFEGVWSFRSDDGVHVAWLTRGEAHSLRFDVYCLLSTGEVIARVEVLANNTQAPSHYDVVVPVADRYIVAEVDCRWGSVTESKVAVFSEALPPRIAELRSPRPISIPADVSSVSGPTTGPTRVWATAGAESGGGVDFVIYSSRSDFFWEIFGMFSELEDMGYELTAWDGGETWQDARLVAEDAFEHNVEVEHPRLPTLIIVGSAKEGVVGNVVSTVYYADETGECELGTCASDAKIVDFDDDDIPDMPWTRVLGRTQTEIAHATEAALRYLGCEAFGPQRAVILDGDVKSNDQFLSGCTPLPEPRAMLGRINDQLQAANVPTVTYHESDYPCHDWVGHRSSMLSMFAEGITELIGIGYLTSRRHFPGGFIQDMYEPFFRITDVPYPQVFVAELFACGSGDEDGANSLPDPLLVEAFMTSDPDQYPIAVTWLGNRRGGFIRNHMELAERYFSNKLASDGNSSLQEILFSTIRELALENPSSKNHLLLTTAFGWPAWPSNRCVPPAVVTTKSSNQAHIAVVTACPQGDADTLVVSVDFDDEAATRDFSANEVTLDVSDFSATVFDADGILPAGSNASAPLHKTSIRHSRLGGCSNEAVDVLLNGFSVGSPATSAVRSPDLSGDGIVNLTDFATFGSPYFPRNGVAGDCSDFNNDDNVNLGDFATFGAHNQHVSPYGPANGPTAVLSSNAGIVLRFTEEYPTATTHRLYVDIDVDGFSGVSKSLFALAPGNNRVTFTGWHPSEGMGSSVLFASVDRDGEEQLYFGMLEVDSYTESARSLGRLSFNVLGVEPLEVAENEFQLAAGEVLLEGTGDGNMIAQMSGVLGRTLAPNVARIYHNRLEQNFPNPFNPTTTLAFSIKEAASVSLTIYDVAGRRVRELVNERRDRGVYKVVWDGQNDAGQTVASGVYFYKMTAGSFKDTKKMTILK